MLPKDKNDLINIEIFCVNLSCQRFSIKKILIIFSKTNITEQVIMKDREGRKRTDRTSTGEGILNATSSSSFPRKKGTGCHLSRPSASFCSLLELTGRTRRKGYFSRALILKKQRKGKGSKRYERREDRWRKEDRIDRSSNSSKEERRNKTKIAKKKSPRSALPVRIQTGSLSCSARRTESDGYVFWNISHYAINFFLQKYTFLYFMYFIFASNNYVDAKIFLYFITCTV